MYKCRFIKYRQFCLLFDSLHLQPPPTSSRHLQIQSLLIDLAAAVATPLDTLFVMARRVSVLLGQDEAMCRVGGTALE